MKSIRNIFGGLLVAGLTMSTVACEDWFDESPKTNVKADLFFNTENGFQSALTGVYIQLTNESLYAGTLSFGFVDQLAQQYDYMPDGTFQKDAIYNYATGSSGSFGSKRRIEAAWTGLYNTIANCNNLIKWLDLKGETVVRDAKTRQMLRAEALAVSAFCHFDLLRGWGPANYRNAAGADTIKCVPFRTVADNSKQPRMAAGQLLERIVAQLKQAQELLAYEKGISLRNNERRYRFNYYAVTALLARVYAYQGDAEQAIACAKEVIDDCGLELQMVNLNDPALFSEAICALNKYQMQDNLASLWADGDKLTTQLVISQAKFQSLFEVSGSRREDMRSKSTAFYNYETKQKSLSKKYTQNDAQAIPLIRLPEMYYIVCEMSNDMEQSRYYLNYVRNKRGYSSSVNEKFTDAAGRLTALDKEYRKEFYAEGQYWWFLKLRGLTQIPYERDVTLSNARFVWPLPDAEVQYGWTDETENETPNP
ncbi:MAG: RagB/SusD family nutrient uptake outer membrane protein [Bacteroidaceae bacterium]|nr:RagB/SusD family nutrient uptake outer membrane protein [Bacteroidaceae bacterium]